MRRQVLLTKLMLLCFWLNFESVKAQQTPVYWDSEATFRNAQMHYEQENYATAMEQFTEYLDKTEQKATTEVEIKRTQSLYYQALSARELDHPDAEYLLSQFVKNQQGQLANEANFHLGQLYFERKYYRDVIQCFREVETVELDNALLPEFYFQFAYSYFATKNFKNARLLFNRIINVRNEYFHDANYYYGIIAFFNKDFDTALRSFQRIEKNKRYSGAIPYYISLIYYFRAQYDQLLTYAAPRANKANNKYRIEMNQLVGQTYFNQKQFREALPFLEYYVNQSKKISKEDAYQLAFTQYKVGRYQEAIKNFQELNALKELMGQNAIYHMADCYLRVGQKAQARNAFAEAGRMNYDREIQEVSAFNHAKLSYELGYTDQAINALQNFITYYPFSSFTNEAKTHLTQIFETSKNYREALDILGTMQEKSPQMLKTLQKVAYLRGVELFKNMDYQAAIAHFDQSLQNATDKDIEALCHFWKADILFKRMNFKGAIGGMAAFLKASNNRYISEKANPATAYYTIGYSFYEMQQYQNALEAFDKSVESNQQIAGRTSSKSIVRQLYPDALLRSGDCNFLMRYYAPAKNRYQQVIQARMEGTDYALYQNGILSGLTNRQNDKIINFRELLEKYPNSLYADDAMYQVALTQTEKQNYKAAVSAHEQLQRKYPQSPYIAQSLLDQALIFFNIKKYAKALEKYELVLKRYPQTKYSNDALAGSKDVFITKGDAKGYGKYVRRFPNVQFTPSEEDSLTFEIAENFYNSNNCDRAVQELNRYIKRFPKGAYILYAHHYRGTCLYAKEQFADAGQDFNFIIDRYPNTFYEEALDKGARISFYIEKDYETAFQRYKKLAEITSNKELVLESLRGLLKSSYYTKRGIELTQASKNLLAQANANEQDQIDARFYNGLLAYEINNEALAMTEMQEVMQLTDNEQGAEARYIVAEIHFNRGELVACETACKRTATETSGAESWVAKSFLLLTEVYILRDELFQAKATLKSIIENYEPDDEIKQAARSRLTQVQAMEEARSKLEAEKDTNIIELEMKNDDY